MVEAPSTRTLGLWLLASGLAVGLTFGMSAGFSAFVFDDKPVLSANPLMKSPPSWKGFLLSDWWGKPKAKSDSAVYRPLASALLWLEHQLFGSGSAGPYKALNLLWFWACAWLLMLLCVELGLGHRLAFGVGLGFVVLPVHTDVVVSIAGRADLMMTAFLLWGLWCHLRRQRGRLYKAGAVVALALALGAKEFAIVFVGLVLVADHARQEDKALLRWPAWRALPWTMYGAYLACSLAYLWLRFEAVGSLSGSRFGFYDNPLIPASFGQRLLNAPAIFWHYLSMLFAPTSLSFDKTYGAIAILETPWHPEFWLGLLSLVVMATMAWRLREERRILLLLGWFAVFYLPISNVLIPATAPTQDRWLFLPSIPFCALLLLALERGAVWLRQKSRAVALGAGLAVALYGACLWGITIHYTYQWRSELSLYGYAVASVPNALKVRDLYAQALIKEKRYDEALVQLQEALRIKPGFLAAQVSMARIYEIKRQYAMARGILLHLEQKYGQRFPHIRREWLLYQRRASARRKRKHPRKR